MDALPDSVSINLPLLASPDLTEKGLMVLSNYQGCFTFVYVDSKRADVGYSTIRRIFDDPYYSVNFATLERIARALEVPTTDLIEEVPDDPNH